MKDNFEKNEAEMLISLICLQSVIDNPKCTMKEYLQEAFKIFNQSISKELIVNLDKKFCASENKELKEIYFKYPVHDSINDKMWKNKIVDRYTDILRKIKTHFSQISEEEINNFLNAKKVLDKMILDKNEFFELIKLQNKKGLDKIINLKKIKKATNYLENIRKIWEINSKIVYKYIDESEKNIYESLLGARL